MRVFLSLATFFVFCSIVIAEEEIKVPISQAMKIQILLDRAGYSPGEIDGRLGRNTKKALAAFQRHNQLKPTGSPDPATLKILQTDDRPYLRYHTISERDTAGPFIPKYPRDLQEQTKLERLEYTSVIEWLGESFHVNPAILKILNPTAKFRTDEKIIVPNIVSLDELMVTHYERKPIRIYVSKKNSDLTVRDENEKVLMYAPVTQGDYLAPLPFGKWKVETIEDYPYFGYDPKLFSRPNKKHKGGSIPPGPNNPVGIVWIDLDLPHMGLHGTSAPEKVGHTASNGCIRLTNWDVFRLSMMVQQGTEVHFVP